MKEQEQNKEKNSFLCPNTCVFGFFFVPLRTNLVCAKVYERVYM